MSQTNENRRDFLKKASIAALSLPLLLSCKNNTLAQKSSEDILDSIKKNAKPDGTEGMGAIDAPKTVSRKTILSTDADKGEKMSISGTVFKADGETPAPNVLIYIYHTDIEGYYGRKSGEHKHGRYRGWMLTDSRGGYEFQTIKPAPYPENRFAAHIHATLTTTTFREDWIDSYLFEGDKLISEQERKTAGQRGGFQPILNLKKTTSGIWTARRDIRLWEA